MLEIGMISVHPNTVDVAASMSIGRMALDGRVREESQRVQDSDSSAQTGGQEQSNRESSDTTDVAQRSVFASSIDSASALATGDTSAARAESLKARGASAYSTASEQAQDTDTAPNTLAAQERAAAQDERIETDKAERLEAEGVEAQAAATRASDIDDGPGSNTFDHRAENEATNDPFGLARENEEDDEIRPALLGTEEEPVNIFHQEQEELTNIFNHAEEQDRIRAFERSEDNAENRAASGVRGDDEHSVNPFAAEQKEAQAAVATSLRTEEKPLESPAGSVASSVPFSFRRDGESTSQFEVSGQSGNQYTLGNESVTAYQLDRVAPGPFGSTGSVARRIAAYINGESSNGSQTTEQPTSNDAT